VIVNTKFGGLIITTEAQTCAIGISVICETCAYGIGYLRLISFVPFRGQQKIRVIRS